MNILKKEYGTVWEINNKFKFISIDDYDIADIETIESVCIFLAINLNCDCDRTGQPIDDFVLDYLIVDCDKEVFNICFRHKGDDVIIYLESRGETIVSFNMSEFISDKERHY